MHLLSTTVLDKFDAEILEQEMYNCSHPFLWYMLCPMQRLSGMNADVNPVT